MPVATIRRYAQLVREGTGNESERLELLQRHRQEIAARIGELERCLELIEYKVGFYEQRLAEGTADRVWSPPAPDG